MAETPELSRRLGPLTRTTYGTRAVISLSHAHEMSTHGLPILDNAGYHLLFKTSTLYAYGLGSLHGSHFLNCFYCWLHALLVGPCHQIVLEQDFDARILLYLCLHTHHK